MIFHQLLLDFSIRTGKLRTRVSAFLINTFYHDRVQHWFCFPVPAFLILNIILLYNSCRLDTALNSEARFVVTTAEILAHTNQQVAYAKTLHDESINAFNHEAITKERN